MTDLDYLTVNKALWDERVPVHLDSEFYDLDGFLAGAEALRPFELAEVGDVGGADLVHLQCHFGLDTLAWARHGARVTGLDFSAPAIEAARRIADSAGLSARFVTADVYSAVDQLAATYDIVYTGIGALCWLPDITRWARVVAALLRPGGFLYLAEFHPFTDVLDDVTGTTVTLDYFAEGPEVWDEPDAGTYADRSASMRNTTSVEFRHGLGEILTALAAAGLRLEFLHEHDHTLFPRFEALERHGIEYRFPPGRARVPLMYSLKATRQR
ncbi:class I SAM-dependent methyltransferase [Nocardia farcinica]|uniref:class I SAM-dependent methyltransferase n=1 Tax=Nocardia farcinica TaxID=37329 RepID=UPI000A38BE12|nr:class I SAM-dependent methyltransferase [Nocardia farcinica]MBA4858305.1 class I SAM-dependent methyltransferase [Nocardia farcinica]MBC9818074.1 class I SAM-dependent methyltransferase [Nocardia farcinica]MBF6067883.1 class I SAM-dependent methyltransferase [Nocardia farcinica]MBF6255613.1 class I SAM-dependent methyltransferase [Nocardia farcinica]MBF6418858.1 class I SAM-dependent methyltransferase [Nocardia farcinica]